METKQQKHAQARIDLFEGTSFSKTKTPTFEEVLKKLGLRVL